MIFYVSLTLASDITKIIYHFSNIKYEFIPLILMIQFLALVIKGLRQKKLLDDINVRLTFKENQVIQKQKRITPPKKYHA